MILNIDSIIDQSQRKSNRLNYIVWDFNKSLMNLFPKIKLYKVM